MKRNSEDLVIATLLQYPELFENLMLSVDMFEVPDYQKTIQFFIEEGKADKHALYAKAKSHKDNFITSREIRELLNEDLVSKYFFNQYQQEVLDAYKSRELFKAMDLYKTEPTRENHKFLQDTVNELDKISVKQPDTKKEILTDIYESIMTGEETSIIKTGFKSLDETIGGFKPKQLNIIGARPSMGKTAFAINLAENLTKQNCEVTFVSCETGERNITERLLASMAGVNLSKFTFVKALTNEDIDKIITQIDRYSRMDLKVIDQAKVKPSTIRRMMANKTDKQKVIVIDYIQLMSSDIKTSDRRLEIESISRDLKILAKETNAVIIILAQVKREVEQRQDKRPMMSDLKEAGGLEQDADIISFLYRDDYYNPPEIPDTLGKSEVECIIAKNKDGATGTTKLDFYKKVQRFTDV